MLNFGKIERKSPRVNLIPIINVVFLVLIYFITQGSLTKLDPLAVSIPTSATAEKISAEPLEIFVTATDTVLGKEHIKPEELGTKLTALTYENPRKRVILKIDAKTDSGKFIALLHTIKDAGVTDLYMVTANIKNNK